MNETSNDREAGPTRDRIQRMVDLSATPEAVWAVIGNFADMGWHPLVRETAPAEIEGAAYRHVTLDDDEVFMERLAETGPRHMSYEIVDGPLPISDHLATLSVTAQGAGCRVFWSALFEPHDGADAWCDRLVAGFYEAGLAALAERFEG